MLCKTPTCDGVCEIICFIILLSHLCTIINKAVLYSNLLTGYTLSKLLYSKNSASNIWLTDNKLLHVVTYRKEVSFKLAPKFIN